MRRYTSAVHKRSVSEGVRVKKGRHRRFEEARALKRSIEVELEPCAECGAEPEDDHASWCRATEPEEDDALAE